MPTGRTVRCKRCKTRTANSLNLEGWAADVKEGQIVGYICPDCLITGEAKELPKGQSLDIGHGYDDVDYSIKGNFKFLKKSMEEPQYYGKREARLDWETFADSLRRAMLEVGSGNGFAMDIEIQTLWNFRLEVTELTSNGRAISATGYHTHGMKKGKQLDPNLINNLLAMGMVQPTESMRDWTIQLKPQECVDSHLNRVIVHILERGYEFNPNLIQQVVFEALG